MKEKLLKNRINGKNTIPAINNGKYGNFVCENIVSKNRLLEVMFKLNYRIFLWLILKLCQYFIVDSSVIT